MALAMACVVRLCCAVVVAVVGHCFVAFVDTDCRADVVADQIVDSNWPGEQHMASA